MTAARIRLRRVKFKDGRTIEVFRKREAQTVNAAYNRSVSKLLDEFPKIMAYSLVAWDDAGRAFVAYEVSDDCPIVAGQIPQLTKDALLAETTIRWITP